jgi:hypothetical protein
VSPVRSSVVPDGTATEDNTIVAHEALDLLAAAAPLEPENVHEALFARSGAAVGAGAAVAREIQVATRPRRVLS